MVGRILVALVGVPLLIVILLFCPYAVLPVAFGLLSAIGAYELLRATGAVKRLRMIVYAILLALCVPFWYYFGCHPLWAVGGLFVFLLLLFGEAIASRQETKAEEIALCCFAGLIIPMMLSVFVLMSDAPHARLYLLLPFVSAFTSDAFALFAGMSLGKHKLAPVLSPKKTVEGSVGGFLGAMVCCLIYGLVVQYALPVRANLLALALYGLLASLVSQMGDLSFSYIKREYGIKDYGKLFREHGGVLDRFDSVIFCAPLTFLLMNVIPFFA
jgi:phosphatidate cytidylyltransferase